MNVRYWKSFLRVAQAGSISRVADDLAIPQPVLSRQIKSLETELGISLFNRHGRGMRLTPAGELFANRADAILGQIAALPVELESRQEEPFGALSVGLPPSMTSLLTGRVVSAYIRKYPAVTLNVRETTLVALRHALISTEIELGVVSLPLIDPQLVVEPLVDEPMYLVGLANSDQLPRNRIRLKQLATLPLIMPKRPNSIRVIVENAMERAGLRPNILLEADFAPAFECVADGFGYCPVPSCALSSPTLGKRIKSTRISDLSISWGIVRLKERPLSMAASAFQSEIVKAVRSLIQTKQWKATIIA